MPPPSSAISITTSLPTWRTVSAISPVSDLPAARRASRDSMPWSSALRSRCSSGPTSFSSTERSSSTCAAVDLEVGALVELLRGRAHDAIQALGQAAERHRADREQPLLHFARQPCLREQRGIGVVEVLEQRLLHRRDVVDAFGQRARELLEPRVAVELERIEVAVLLVPACSATGSATRPGSRSRASASAGGSRWSSARAGSSSACATRLRRARARSRLRRLR